MTVALLALSWVRTASPRPLPYSDLSSTTKTFLAAAAPTMKSAMAGPWTPSFGTTRCQYFQPFSARATAVAEAEMLGIFASSSNGPTCLDSPEKAGPTSATTLSVLIACCARLTAVVGSALLSYLIISILTLGLVALYSSTASWAPLLGGMTIPEFSPDRSPIKPIFSVVGAAESPPSDDDPESLPQAARPTVSATPTASTPPRRAILGRKVAFLSPDPRRDRVHRTTLAVWPGLVDGITPSSSHRSVQSHITLPLRYHTGPLRRSAGKVKVTSAAPCFTRSPDLP